MTRFGASFSPVYARDLGVPPKTMLRDALEDLGVRRLRLMSFWNRIEKNKGRYDFRELDWQISLAEQYGAEITLCLGLRQPHWPESHWPDWAAGLPDVEWRAALYDFIKAVVERYKDRRAIVSYQLENEALLQRFGAHGNFDRGRLVEEFQLVRSLDPVRPIIMSCSDSWGIPLRAPKPDAYAFSVYRHFYDRGRYRSSARPALFYRLRAILIRLLKRRKAFIHELQAEPWGPKGTNELSVEEQFRSMDPARVRDAVRFAQRTGLYPIDLWGMEWWYWLKTRRDKPEVWNYMRSVFRSEQ